MKISLIISALAVAFLNCAGHPLLYDPYYKVYRYSQPFYGNPGRYDGNHIAPYHFNPLLTPTRYFGDGFLAPPRPAPSLPFYGPSRFHLPALNVLPEVPFSVANQFSVVPMVLVAQDALNMINDKGVQIMNVSSHEPSLMVKLPDQHLIPATPALKVVLDAPIVVYSVRTAVLVPSEMTFLYQQSPIPIKIGAVIAPVLQDTLVTPERPITLSVVYAVPLKPVQFDYVNNDRDVVVDADKQSIAVESEGSIGGGQKVTVLNFPDAEAEPVLVDEDDILGEIVNRNPPQAVIPAGIVQSTQPQSDVTIFTNSKESTVLNTLREESNRNRLKAQSQ